MNCPFCKRPLTEGTISTRGVARRPTDGVYFVAPDGTRTEIDKYTTGDALQCEDCGTLILKGRFAD